MNWDAISAVGESLGAISVLITLIYLSTQIRQANRVSRFSTSRDIMAQFNDQFRLYATDKSIRDVLLKEGELTQDENECLYNFALMYCNAWSTTQIAFDQDQIDEVILLSATKDIDHTLARWDNIHAPIRQWMIDYPELAQLAIFKDVKKQLLP